MRVLVLVLVLVLVIMLHWLLRPKQVPAGCYSSLALRTVAQAFCSSRRQDATPRVSATGGHPAECELPKVSQLNRLRRGGGGTRLLLSRFVDIGVQRGTTSCTVTQLMLSTPRRKTPAADSIMAQIFRQPFFPTMIAQSEAPTTPYLPKPRRSGIPLHY